MLLPSGTDPCPPAVRRPLNEGFEKASPCRVCFAAPARSSWHFPYAILRHRYVATRDGDRRLEAKTLVTPIGREDAPEGLATAIELELTNPY
jgi:hypothetical protein